MYSNSLLRVYTFNENSVSFGKCLIEGWLYIHHTDGHILFIKNINTSAISDYHTDSVNTEFPGEYLKIMSNYNSLSQLTNHTL